MSHLVCPLCGKNAPLSTLNPENLPFDLKLVSFKGLGREMGFAKSEEVSIMGDEEFTPIIADRIDLLYKFFVERRAIKVPLIGFNDELIIKQIEALKRQLLTKDLEINSLSNNLKEITENDELDRQVDYIIRESLDLANAHSQLVADDSGWHLNLPNDSPELGCYLFLIMTEISSQLKERLLRHVIREGNPTFYDSMLKHFPKRQSIAEQIMDIDNESAIETIDEFGKQYVRILKPRYYPEYAGKSISSEELTRLIKRIKGYIRDPEFDVLKNVYDIVYPLRRKLPIRGDTKTS
jgi:hypothetical protein